jgi:uncharacterized protein (TIGR04540 family)
MNTYYKSQRDLANALIRIIDSYWDHNVTEKHLLKYLQTIYENNSNKIIDENSRIKSVVKQRLGKKRLSLIIQILNINEEELQL